MIIHRPNGIGILLTKIRDFIAPADTEASLVIQDLVIEDRVEENTTEVPALQSDTTAMVSGWDPLVTSRQPDFILNQVSHNCTVGKIPLNDSLNEWTTTNWNTINPIGNTIGIA